MKFGDDPRLFHDADGSSKGVVTISDIIFFTISESKYWKDKNSLTQISDYSKLLTILSLV